MANERETRRGDTPKSGGNTTPILAVVAAVVIVLVLAFWLWPTGDDEMIDEPNVEGIQQGAGTDPEGIADVPDEPSIGDEETVIENGASTGLDPVTDQTLEVPDSPELDTTPGEAPAEAGDLAPDEPDTLDTPAAEEDAPVVEEDAPVVEEQ